MNSFQYIIPDEEGFKNNMLDNLLAAGFYRMQHMMFTCNETVISDTNISMPVFWLRTLVKQYKLNSSANTILKKCSGFRVLIQKAYVDEEIEELYADYKNHVAFSISETAADYLHNLLLPQPFNSMMVQVYDKKKLIATGYFDKGSNAIAGIMNIYQPSYKKYSLGKFMILQKLKYATEHNIQFYYTGYMSTESTRFDYKTFPDLKAVEAFLPLEKRWVPYEIFNKKFLAEYYNKYIKTDT